MQKRILVLLLSISIKYAFANSPAQLIAQECIKLPEVTLSTISKNDFAAQLDNLEQQLLQLNNYKDQIHYFRQQKISDDDKELLLSCQLHLADQLTLLLNKPSFSDLIEKLFQSKHSEYQNLATNLLRLKKQNLPTKEKAQLHTAQIQFQQNLKKRFALAITNPKCQLKPVKHSPIPLASSISIAQYLIKQKNESCRKKAWIDYQQRAEVKNKIALARIINIRTEQAQNNGYQNYNDYIFIDDYLNSDKLAWHFLNSISEQLTTTPWSIGQSLAREAKTKFTPQKFYSYLTIVEQQLLQLGIRLERPTNKVLRFWYKQHLLGDIYLKSGDTNQYTRTSLPVVGRQYGAGVLVHQNVIKSKKHQANLILAISQAIADLSGTSRFYFNNLLTPSKQIGVFWLRAYLSKEVEHYLTQPIEPREKLIQNYIQQLTIFRAKTTLASYANKANLSQEAQIKLSQIISDAFSKSFTQPLANASFYQYSYDSIALQGPNSYLNLWYEFVAKTINQHKLTHITPDMIYQILLLNEQRLTFSEQLSLLIGYHGSAEGFLEKYRDLKIK